MVKRGAECYGASMLRRLDSLAAFAVAASLAALAGALIAQYGFGLRPCVLCIAQRIPFAVAAAAGLGALLLPMPEAVRRRLVATAGVLFLVNAGIAVYHVGVERHWWASPGCAAAASAAVTARSLAEAMSRPVEVPCDKPAWQWHGVTMAALNIVYSGALAAVTLLLVRRREGTR